MIDYRKRSWLGEMPWALLLVPLAWALPDESMKLLLLAQIGAIAFQLWWIAGCKLQKRRAG